MTFLQGDILAPGDLEQAEGHNIDKIVHAAVFTGVLPEVEASRSRSIVEINVMGTTNLLELARRIKPKRFLYVSSGSVYGERPQGEDSLREDAPLHPHTLYESTKYVSELLTRRFGEMHGFQTLATRLSSPYGPMERVTGHRANQSVIKDITGRIVRGEDSVAVLSRGWFLVKGTSEPIRATSPGLTDIVRSCVRISYWPCRHWATIVSGNVRVRVNLPEVSVRSPVRINSKRISFSRILTSC